MGHYLALTGGIGGAKLVLGLSRVLPVSDLTVAVNIGDDFCCYGLPVCPDIDTTLYTLAGLNDPVKGWGRVDESWVFHQTLKSLMVDSPTNQPWFQLGDRDLALHVARKLLLDQGLSLTEATCQLAQNLGVSHRVVPISDQPISTVIDTAQGVLAFQDYFVRLQAKPVVKALRYQGSESAQLSPAVAQALQNPELAGVIICPSNPWLSIDPVLAVPGLVETLQQVPVPVIAVSPIVDGKAIKGPTAKIMQELGLEPSVIDIARHYQPWLNGLVLDNADNVLASEIENLGIVTSCTATVMHDLADKIALAEHCLALIERLVQKQLN